MKQKLKELKTTRPENVCEIAIVSPKFRWIKNGL